MTMATANDFPSSSSRNNNKKISTVSNDSEFEHLITSTDMTCISSVPRRGINNINK